MKTQILDHPKKSESFSLNVRSYSTNSEVAKKHNKTHDFGNFLKTCDELGLSGVIYTYKYPYPITKPYTIQFKSDGFHEEMKSDKNELDRTNIYRLFQSNNSYARNECLKAIYHLVRDIHGGVGSFYLKPSGVISADTILTMEYFLVKLCTDTHQYISEDIGIHYRYTKDVLLTKREREILRWTADGKTCIDIANILSISKRTVEFHISNAIEKLGTPTKCAAVVKALMLGILTD